MESRRSLDQDPFLFGREGREGAGRWRFPARRFSTPARGVRAVGPLPADLASRLRAVGLVLPPGWVACGPTAARLYDLPVPEHLDHHGRLLHLAIPAPLGATPPALPDGRRRSRGSRAVKVRRRDIRWHRLELDEDDWWIDAECPVTRPERTFVDLAATLSLPELVAVGDVLVRRSLADQARLDEAVRRRRRRRGVRAARRAVPLLDPRSDSPQESRARVIIIEAGLPAPTPNVAIRDESGEFLARGDLVYEHLRIVIEYDGAMHADPRRRAADATRRTLLRENGWYVVEVTAADLRFPQRLVAKVTAALRIRGAVW